MLPGEACHNVKLPRRDDVLGEEVLFAGVAGQSEDGLIGLGRFGVPAEALEQRPGVSQGPQRSTGSNTPDQLSGQGIWTVGAATRLEEKR